jgi:hypothetical protein
MKKFIILTVLLVGCCCPQKSKEQIEKDRVAKAAASAKRAVEAAEMAEVKKRCGDRFGTKDWEDTCRNLVKERLFQPSSANFSHVWSVARVDDKEQCQQVYSSTVESKNAFGTIIEHRFQCTFKPSKNWVTLDYVKMN